MSSEKEYSLSPQTKKFIEDNIEIIEAGNFEEITLNALINYGEKVLQELKEAFLCCQIEGANLSEYIHPIFSKRRIKKVKCYNVGFGDCFLCKDENENGNKLLVDFGARRADKKVVCDLKNELSNAKNKYLMISHLHEDHYRGFKNVKYKDISFLQFDEIYLPNYITNGGLEFLGEELLLSNNNQLIKQVIALLKIPFLFPKYIKDGAKIFLLREGNRRYTNLCTFKVLLPKKDAFSHIMNPQTKHIVKEFTETYISLLGYSEEGEEFASISRYSEAIEKEFDDIIERLLKNKADVTILTDEKVLKERFKQYHNTLSLAFHELYIKDLENVLFLGDAKKEELVGLNLNTKYRFVKVQHHGTKAHFHAGLPYADYYSIPNGKAKNTEELSCLYDHHYGMNTAFICPNNINCELHKNNCSCNSLRYNRAICGFSPYHEVTI